MLPGPTKGPCECRDDCGLFGTLGRPDSDDRRHVRGCCCRSCKGRRARRGGLAKQRLARKRLGIAGPSLGADHEENWRGAVRVEVKSGSREATPVQIRYLACEKQAEAGRAIGDNREFVAIFMPPGTSEGFVVVRLSKMEKVARAWLSE